MKPWWITACNWRLWVLSLALFYGAFQKKLLPDPLAIVAGRLFFYPTWPFTYLTRHNAYWTLMDSHVLLGAAPMSFMGHVDRLYGLSVRAVINLCDEYGGPVAQYKKFEITQLSLPTIDHTEPSLQDIETAIAFIREKKESGVRIYIHCKSGHGRSAAIVFCWLLYTHPEWTLEETQLYMNEKRNVRKTLYTQPHIIQYYQQIHH